MVRDISDCRGQGSLTFEDVVKLKTRAIKNPSTRRYGGGMRSL